MRALLNALLLLQVLCCFAQIGSLGANLTETSPYGTLWYYTNALKQSTGWLVYNSEDEGDAINFSSEITYELAESFEEFGYPLEVPFASGAHPETEGKSLVVSCLVLNNQPAPYFYPSGNYLLSFEGSGTLTLQGDLDSEFVQFEEAGQYSIPISNPTSFGVQLFITSSEASDPIRNVQLIFPNYVETFEDQRFQNEALSLFSEFEVLRFMKPLKSENNTIEDFLDRSVREDFSYFLDADDIILPGMPYEDVIDISNRTNTDMWVTIPYRASDDYVREMAQLFNRQMNGGNRLYLEYSNETWNPAYPLTREYMMEMGEFLATSDIPEVREFEAIHRYQAYRTLQIAEIFEDVFTNDDLLVIVHGGQSDPYTADLIAEAYDLSTVNPNGRMPDGVAVAAYIGVTLFDDLRDQGIEICDHSPHQLLDTLTRRTQPELREMLTRYQELFADTEVELMAYEGGQHVTELNFQPMEPCAETLVLGMNRLPEMQEFFCELLDTWYDTYDGGLYNVFNLVEGPDAFGAFGVLESQWQNRDDSYKWLGLVSCESLTTENPHSSFIYPNPVKDIFHLAGREAVQIRVTDLSGQLVKVGQGSSLDIEDLKPGIYIVEISEGPNKRSVQRIVKQ